MKRGEPIRMRLLHKDIMTLVDVAVQNGYALHGASLASVCRMAVSSMCQMARDTGLAPTRKDWEYDDVTGPFRVEGKEEARHALTKRAQQAGVRPAAVRPASGVTTMPLTPPEQARLQALAAMRGEAILQGILEKDWDAAHPDLAKEFYMLEARI